MTEENYRVPTFHDLICEDEPMEMADLTRQFRPEISRLWNDERLSQFNPDSEIRRAAQLVLLKGLMQYREAFAALLSDALDKAIDAGMRDNEHTAHLNNLGVEHLQLAKHMSFLAQQAHVTSN